jgi:hypothetical protein
MNQAIINVDEVEWKGVPIKHCEFKRASKDLIAMDRSDLEYVIMKVTLGCLAGEDRDIIIRSMSPTLSECIKGSKDTKMNYLANLMKLIVFRYKQHKLEALRSSSIFSEPYDVRAHQHYEALRSLKESLICGRSLLEREMPEVKAD